MNCQVGQVEDVHLAKGIHSVGLAVFKLSFGLLAEQLQECLRVSMVGDFREACTATGHELVVDKAKLALDRKVKPRWHQRLIRHRSVLLHILYADYFLICECNVVSVEPLIVYNWLFSKCHRVLLEIWLECMPYRQFCFAEKRNWNRANLVEPRSRQPRSLAYGVRTANAKTESVVFEVVGSNFFVLPPTQ